MKMIATMVTACVAGLALPAHAGDTKFYPATLCEATDGLTASYAASGAAYNTRTDREMTLVCPLVRDVERSDGLGWSSLIINALNLTPQPNNRWLTCVAQTFNIDDYLSGTAYSVAVPPNTNWTDMSFGVASVPASGYMLISCQVPRMYTYPSGLASYRIDE